MHELSITQSLVDAVAEKVKGVQVRELTMEIGKLSGVVPDAVRFCFEIVSSGTPLEGAILTILEPTGAGACRTCGLDFTMDDAFPLCPCGSADVEITGGRQLRVKFLEVG
jgi:hydrogenase nickel incorporation protein HypA/HybF